MARGARRRGSGGSPRAPSASPSGLTTTCRAGGASATASGSNEPVRPVALRSPPARRRFANGRTTLESGSAARSAAGTVAAAAAASPRSAPDHAEAPSLDPGPPAWAVADEAQPEPEPTEDESAPSRPEPRQPAQTQSPSSTARQAITPTRTTGQPDATEPPSDPQGGARHDDDDVETAGLDGAQLLQEALGAQVIEEIPHQ